MADDSENAVRLLWVVSIGAFALLGVLAVMAGPGTDGASLAFGGGGVCVGALAATAYHWRRRRVRQPEGMTTLTERMQALELDQARMAELEERVDFAERMLARAQDEALLPDGRRDGRSS